MIETIERLRELFQEYVKIPPEAPDRAWVQADIERTIDLLRRECSDRDVRSP